MGNCWNCRCWKVVLENRVCNLLKINIMYMKDLLGYENGKRIEIYGICYADLGRGAKKVRVKLKVRMMIGKYEKEVITFARGCRYLLAGYRLRQAIKIGWLAVIVR